MEYTKPWLSIDEQIDRLSARGLRIHSREEAAAILYQVGYYRLSGYLYPFRASELSYQGGREHRRILDRYRDGTSLEAALSLLEFDRSLRLLVLEGMERIEVAFRMRLGYVLGRQSAFAHEESALLTTAFTAQSRSGDTSSHASSHAELLEQIEKRKKSSDEDFVTHFRDKYENKMPIWALTEILELGQLSRLYGGLRNDIATEIAQTLSVPSKRLLRSWIASLNYVRNISAHHARLFNRKLVAAPARPHTHEAPLLAHLRDQEAPKQFGAYSALAVMAYFLRSIDPGYDWPRRMRELLRSLPTPEPISPASVGFRVSWLEEDLWVGVPSP